MSAYKVDSEIDSDFNKLNKKRKINGKSVC